MLSRAAALADCKLLNTSQYKRYINRAWKVSSPNNCQLHYKLKSIGVIVADKVTEPREEKKGSFLVE